MIDQFGIVGLYKTKQNGKVINLPEFGARSQHSGGNRDQWSASPVDFLPMEITCYIKSTSDAGSDELSYKFWGGSHGDSNPKTGRCYEAGIENNGAPHIAKEYPQHPQGNYGLGSSKAVYADPNFKNVGVVQNRRLGYKVITRLVNNVPTFEVYVDLDPFVDGKPQNHWRKWYTARDDGSWGGDPYLQNQGVVYGGVGEGKMYLRIDNVNAPSSAYGFTIRELDDIPILDDGSIIPPPPPQCPTGQHRDLITGLCVPDVIIPPPPSTPIESSFPVTPLAPLMVDGLPHNYRAGFVEAVKIYGSGVTNNDGLVFYDSGLFTSRAITAQPVIVAPTLSLSQLGNNIIKLSWNKVSNAIKVNIERKTSVSNGWIVIGSYPFSGDPNDDTSLPLPNGSGLNEFRVRAIDSTGLIKSPYSNVVNITYNSGSTGTTKHKVLIQLNDSSVYVKDLTDAEVSGFTGGTVYKVDSVKLDVCAVKNNPSTCIRTLFLTLSQLTVNAPYYNQVLQTGGIIKIVDYVLTGGGGGTGIPTAPTNLNIANVDNQVFLVWDFVDTATSYIVEQKNNKVTSFIPRSPIDVPFFDIDLEVNSGLNEFRVKAVNSSGSSSYSNIVSTNYIPTIVNCPTGYHKDPITGLCVPDITSCPTGQHRDPITGLCVPDSVSLTAPVLSISDIDSTHVKLSWNIIQIASRFFIQTRNSTTNGSFIDVTNIASSQPHDLNFGLINGLNEYRIYYTDVNNNKSPYSTIASKSLGGGGGGEISYPSLSQSFSSTVLNFNGNAGSLVVNISSVIIDNDALGRSATNIIQIKNSNGFVMAIDQKSFVIAQSNIINHTISFSSVDHNILVESGIRIDNTIPACDIITKDYSVTPLTDISIVNVFTPNNNNAVQGFLNDTNLSNWTSANNNSTLCNMAIFSGRDVPCSLSYNVNPTKVSSVLHPDNYGSMLTQIRDRFPIDNQCPTGYHKDPVSGICVPNTPPLGDKKDLISMLTRVFIMVTGVKLLGSGQQ